VRLDARREARAAARETAAMLSGAPGWDTSWMWSHAPPEPLQLEAGALAQLGDRDAALAAPGSACDAGWADAAWLGRDPALSALAGDTRRAGLMARAPPPRPETPRPGARGPRAPDACGPRHCV